MKTIITIILLSLSVQSFAQEKVVYGEDNRHEVFEARPEFKTFARSTAARIDRNRLKGWTFNRFWELETKTLEQTGICADERFSQQPTVAECTGFLVSPKHIVTAGHCISNQTCKNGMYYWLFDYHMPEHGPFDPRRSKHDYASCKRVVKRVYERGTGLDYALIELKKEVKGRAPLKFRKEGEVSLGEELVVIGHPSGLPTKIADGAQVRDINPYFFKANLDTFGGNSGSPVINVRTGEVEGILVRGATDYVEDRSSGCHRVNRYADEVAAESATLITNVKELQDL